MRDMAKIFIAVVIGLVVIVGASSVIFSSNPILHNSILNLNNNNNSSADSTGTDVNSNQQDDNNNGNGNHDNPSGNPPTYYLTLPESSVTPVLAFTQKTKVTPTADDANGDGIDDYIQGQALLIVNGKHHYKLMWISGKPEWHYMYSIIGGKQVNIFDDNDNGTDNNTTNNTTDPDEPEPDPEPNPDPEPTPEPEPEPSSEPDVSDE